MTNDQALPGVVDFMGVRGYFRNGKFRPIISGADGTEDSDSQNSEGDDNDGTGSDNQEGTDSEDQSGDKKLSQSEVDEIVKRAKKKATKGVVKPEDLGFKSKEELQKFVETMKSKADEDKTEQEKALQQAVEDAKAQGRKEVLPKAERLFLKAEFKLAAAQAGVRTDALDDAFAIAQLMEDWEVEVDADKETVTGLTADFFKELKSQKPFLFEEKGKGTSKKEKDDVGAGANGGGEAKKDLSGTYSGLNNVL